MKKCIIPIAMSFVLLLITFANRSENNMDCDPIQLLKINNLEALSQNEGSGGSSQTVTCWNEYSDCWFWNCEHVWRCSTIECYDVTGLAHEI